MKILCLASALLASCTAWHDVTLGADRHDAANGTDDDDEGADDLPRDPDSTPADAGVLEVDARLSELE
ncbi:MAG TPA: hypothetical protein VI299_08145 [Polyangiales bacterium]